MIAVLGLNFYPGEMPMYRDMPDSGTSHGRGIPEENQGEEHAAAKVFGKVRSLISLSCSYYVHS